MIERVHIIGIGSAFGDDRLGCVAAEVLRQDALPATAPPGLIEITVLDRPGVLLPMHWRDTDCVLLLDAVRSGAAPGTRHRLEADDLAGAGGTSSSHGIGVREAVALSRILGSLPARLLLRGIEADASWKGFSLSPAVAAALPLFTAMIASEALALVGACPPAVTHPA